jgi:hypothetical protein
MLRGQLKIYVQTAESGAKRSGLLRRLRHTNLFSWFRESHSLQSAPWRSKTASADSSQNAGLVWLSAFLDATCRSSTSVSRRLTGERREQVGGHSITGEPGLGGKAQIGRTVCPQTGLM